MKTMKVSLCVMLFLLPLFVSAQELDSVVAMVNNAKSVLEFIQVRNQLERVSINHPQEWLADYYLAYTDVQLSFRLPLKEEKMRYLNDAQNYLKKLSDRAGADLSEVYTLKGYRLYALIASDPQTNGPRYYGEITADYAKAIELNPNNPRAIILSALFKNDMAKFMNQHYENFHKEVEKATTLFAGESTATIIPTWGKEWIDWALSKR